VGYGNSLCPLPAHIIKHDPSWRQTTQQPICDLAHTNSPTYNPVKKINQRRHKDCAGCSKAEPKFSTPPQTLPGGAGWPKFNQLEMVATFTYKSSLVWIDACISSYRGNRPTKTDTQTDRGDLRPSSKSAQSRRKHCMLAAVRQTISPRHRPPSRGRGTANI